MKVVDGTLRHSCCCQVTVGSMGYLGESCGPWNSEEILLGLAPPEFSFA